MDKHYLVWATYLLVVWGILATAYLGYLFYHFIERTRRNNPAKANLVQFAVCVGLFVIMLSIRIIFTGDGVYDLLLANVALAGLVFSVIFGALFGGLYVYRRINR